LGNLKDKPRTVKLGPIQKLLYGAVGLFFLFGDKALRDFWHFDFWTSMIAWAGVFGVFLIGAIVVSHLTAI